MKKSNFQLAVGWWGSAFGETSKLQLRKRGERTILETSRMVGNLIGHGTRIPGGKNGRRKHQFGGN